MKTILVVEDHDDTREVIRLSLEAGYNVHVSENRDAAIKMIRNGLKPDVVLMDVMMPGMTLEDFLDEMKLIVKRDTPVVLETFAVDGESLADQLGLYFLPKMFKREDLVRTVELCCS